MRLLIDKINGTNTAVLEKFHPTAENATVLVNFCQEALAVPEGIGGIYFNDLNSQQHILELNNQSLYTLIYTLKALALRLPLIITYDNYPVPLSMLETIFRRPGWYIRTLQFFRIIPPIIMYGNLEGQHESSPPLPQSPLQSP